MKNKNNKIISYINVLRIVIVISLVALIGLSYLIGIDTKRQKQQQECSSNKYYYGRCFINKFDYCSKKNSDIFKEFKEINNSDLILKYEIDEYLKCIDNIEHNR